MGERITFLFDFDSTLVSVESLDELIALSLRENMTTEEAAKLAEEIEAITDAGMEGTIDLRASIQRRLSVGRVHKKHLQQLIPILEKSITKGIPAIIDQLKEKGCPVFILSGAIIDCVLPIAKRLGIPAENVFANRAIIDPDGFIVDVADEPMAHSDGKQKTIESLRKEGAMTGTIVMVGDGISDLLPYRAGVVDEFIGVGIHKEREPIRREATHYATTIGELEHCISSVLHP